MDCVLQCVGRVGGGVPWACTHVGFYDIWIFLERGHTHTRAMLQRVNVDVPWKCTCWIIVRIIYMFTSVFVFSQLNCCCFQHQEKIFYSDLGEANMTHQRVYDLGYSCAKLMVFPAKKRFLSLNPRKSKSLLSPSKMQRRPLADRKRPCWKDHRW